MTERLSSTINDTEIGWLLYDHGTALDRVIEKAKDLSYDDVQLILNRTAKFVEELEDIRDEKYEQVPVRRKETPLHL